MAQSLGALGSDFDTGWYVAGQENAWVKQDVLPEEGVTEPGAQGKQAAIDWAEVSWEKKFNGQGVGDVEPRGQYEPAVQFVQNAAPETDAYVPGSQSKHALAWDT